MAKHVPLAVLRDGLTDVQAPSPIGNDCLAQCVSLDGQAAQQVKAPAMQDLFARVSQRRAKSWQPKVLDADVQDIPARRVEPADRRVDLSDFRRRDTKPAGRRRREVARPSRPSQACWHCWVSWIFL